MMRSFSSQQSTIDKIIDVLNESPLLVSIASSLVSLKTINEINKETVLPLRKRLLAILDTEDTDNNFPDPSIYDATYKALIELADIWPLDEEVKNLYGEPIEQRNRLAISTGHVIDITDYGAMQRITGSITNPLTRAKFNKRDEMRIVMLMEKRNLATPHISLTREEVDKSRKIWGTLGILTGIAIAVGSAPISWPIWGSMLFIFGLGVIGSILGVAVGPSITRASRKCKDWLSRKLGSEREPVDRISHPFLDSPRQSLLHNQSSPKFKLNDRQTDLLRPIVMASQSEVKSNRALSSLSTSNTLLRPACNLTERKSRSPCRVKPSSPLLAHSALSTRGDDRITPIEELINDKHQPVLRRKT